MSRRIVIVGCGGTGSWLTHMLAPMMEFAEPQSVIALVDGDAFEPKNAVRQKFVGYGNKAEVLAAELTETEAYPQTYLVPFPIWISEEGLDEVGEPGSAVKPAALFEEGDCIITAVDNYAVRAEIFRYAQTMQNVDVLNPGNDEAYEVTCYHYQRRNGVDITDHPTVWHEEFIDPPDRNPGILSCQERAMIEGGQQVICANVTAAAVTLTQFHRCVLLGEDPCPTGEQFVRFDIGRSGSQDLTPDPVPATATT